jgi:carotenoid cleavage dioxygenase
MKQMLKILLGFFPWILFGIIAGPSLTRLETALAVALAATVALGVKQLRKGFFLTWGTLLFFFLSFILVAFLKNLWVVEHMDLLTQATLAAIAWSSIIAGQPFTLQYARESVPEAYWHTPEFIHTGYFTSIVWGIIFLIALGASLFRPYLEQVGSWLYYLLATGSMFLGIIFTAWYVHRVRKARQTEKL